MAPTLDRPRRLVSVIDDSINWIQPSELGGQFECRFVYRRPRKAVIYLSSQDGCSQACRMCHLTATGQKRFQNASPQEIVSQARTVFRWIDEHQISFDKLHFNFMARGETLSNKTLLSEWSNVSDLLEAEGVGRLRNSRPSILVPTIIPKSSSIVEFEWLAQSSITTIYYSLYSLADVFRRRWLPNAMNPKTAFALLKNWQLRTGNRVRIHFCFIRDENDSLQEMEDLCNLVLDFGLEVDINIVRYNPYSSKYGEESDDKIISRNIEFLKRNLPAVAIKLIPRVGVDVFASCGMFVGHPYA